MTEEQATRLKAKIEAWTKHMLAQGPEACRAYLIRLGVYDKAGLLKESED